MGDEVDLQRSCNLSIASSLTGHWGLEPACFSDAHDHVPLLSVLSIVAPPLGAFDFQGLRKPQESEYDFKGPFGAHLARTELLVVWLLCGAPACFQ